jgi:hypothetical protein
VQRHDHRIRRGTGGRNDRKELRCRNCTHVANFMSSSSFEQGKRQTTFSGARRSDALTGPFNASPDTNRMPLLFGFRIFHRAMRAHFTHFIEPPAFNEFYRSHIFMISRNSGSASGITDKRD